MKDTLKLNSCSTEQVQDIQGYTEKSCLGENKDSSTIDIVQVLRDNPDSRTLPSPSLCLYNSLL